MAPSLSDSDMSDVDSIVDHEQTCNLHLAIRYGLCNAMTYAKRPCRNNANVYRPGYLPVCGRHTSNQQDLPAGNCQAIEDCGQLCNRPALLRPPYNLCEKHEDGSDTLPCLFLQLPTELRLMIFRYLIPKTIRRGSEVQSAVLYVCRPFHQEAASVLYGESQFEGNIDVDGVFLQGKDYYQSPTGRSKDNDFSIGTMLRQDSARLIQNMNLSISLSSPHGSNPKGIGRHGITKEEYTLYTLRDHARKFVELMTLPSDSKSGLTSLKRFNLQVTVRREHRWSPREAVNALFLVTEPFQSLCGIEHPTLTIQCPPYQDYTPFIEKMKAVHSFQNLQGNLIKSLQASVTVSGSETNIVAEKGLEKVLKFYQSVHNRDSIGIGGRSWVSNNVFHGIDRPLHLARVAYENGDISALEKIREAIKIRWINAQRSQQQSLKLIADSINTMFVDSDDESDPESPRKMYPDAFQFDSQEPLPQKRKPDQLWHELEWRDEVPRIGDPEVRFKEKGLRVIIRKGDQEWIRLATPAFVRDIRAAKAASKTAGKF